MQRKTKPKPLGAIPKPVKGSSKPAQVAPKPVPSTKKSDPSKALTKDWVKLEKDVYINNGSYSQSHKRFKEHNDQNASVCVVAIALSSIIKSNLWTKATLDKILEIGTKLHSTTRNMAENRCVVKIEPPQVYKYFYLDDVKVSTRVGVNTLSVRVPRSSSLPQQLENLLVKYFEKNNSGIFVCLNNYFAIWKTDDYYFIFDPLDHNPQGGKWNGLPGLGFCYSMRFGSIKRLADTVLKNINIKQVNKFTIYPCALEKLIKINTVPPETVDGKPPTLLPEKLKVEKKKIKPSEQHGEAKGLELTEPSPVPTPTGSKADLAPPELQPKPSVSKSRLPPEKPRLRSVTNFVELLKGRAGILRASTHQSDPKFTRYLGAQGLANAVAVLTMLRQHKSKTWVRSTLDEVLKLGEVIHYNSKTLQPGHIVDKVTLNDKDYNPKMDRYGTIGRIQSDTDKILNLDRALANFLIDNDCCILVGPTIVAIWREDNHFYMFDPNERDVNGRVAKPDQPGVACITWFKNLNDLIGLYLENLPTQDRNDRFMLAKIAIKDFSPKAENWFNFNALSVNKWILRGSFSQQDRRFPPESRNSQCTANATMALALKELKPEKDWNSETVDEVLLRGDEFYTDSVEYLKENNKYKHRYLMVDEVKRSFDVENKRVNLEIDDCLVNGIINAKSETGLLNLRKGFEEFFLGNDAGIVTANSQSMAVWRRDEVYYYYDSHSRNEKGIVTGYGTACILRLVTIDDLTKILTANLGANTQNLYNISRIAVHLIDLTEDGVVKPPLNYYEALNNLIAILRSNYSENHKKFDLNVGKQTIPNCLAALAMNCLNSSSNWNKEDLDEVLVIGDKLYADSMAANYVEDIPELNIDEVNTVNVKKQFKIGQNSFEIEFDVLSQGTIENNLSEAIDNLYQFSHQESLETFHAILESQYMSVSIWRDENLIYLFDPKPRDEQGQIYGKDDWSAKIENVVQDYPIGYPDEEEVEEYPLQLDEMGGGDMFGPITEGMEEIKQDVTYEPIEHSSPIFIPEEGQEEGEAEEYQPVPLIEKKGSEYWRALEEEGKACVMRFSRIEDLIQHVVENSPPNQRQDIEYTFKSVKITNTPILHEIFDPENEEKMDDIEGDWNEFKEVDYGKWILRSRINYTDSLFPEANRGKQQFAMCIVSLGFVHLYALSKFKQTIVDGILTYGDRFYTVVRRMREKELKGNKELKLSDEEIENILNHTNFKIPDYPKKLCMGEKLAKWVVQLEMILGDITSAIPEEIPSIPAGLQTLFSENTYGILECRDYAVAVWKADDIYYMFDPHPVGPSGVNSPLGVACITRFKNIEDLSEVFLKNLPPLGNNFFEIHAFTMDDEGACPRERKPEVKEEQAPKLGGFTQVMAGKQILRGTMKLDFTKFDRGVHLHSSAIAFVALAMSLVMESDTWTQILINEILMSGEDLYGATIEKLSSKFNGWEDHLDIYRLNNDFKIGSLKANCTLRFTEQRGIVDVKNAKVPNLRQGLERFFQENSHGVLLAGKLTLAVWEETKGNDVSIYVYDPNSRGPTGLPSQGGVACAIKLCNAKVAADHIMATMMDMDKAKTQFALVPVEVVVGSAKSKRKKICKASTPKSVTAKSQYTPKQKKSTMQPSVLLPCSAKQQITAKPQVTTKPPLTTKPVTCPTEADILKEKRLYRRIAEEERQKQEAKRQAILGRNEIYEICPGISIIRGIRCIRADRELPVNLTAFVYMKVASNLSKWTYKQIELILESGYQLYIDSYNTYQPETTKLGLQHILRRVILKDCEVKIDIKIPILCGTLRKENLLANLSKFFNKLTFCMFNYDEFLISLYFKSGYYYMFDPYSRDLHGNKSVKGCAVLMRFGDLSNLVDKVVANFLEPNQEPGEFALFVVAVKGVEPLSRKAQ